MGASGKMAAGRRRMRDAWASRTGLSQMATLICKEVQRILQGEPSNLEERVFIINLRTLTNSSHFFLPDPYARFAVHYLMIHQN